MLPPPSLPPSLHHSHQGSGILASRVMKGMVFRREVEGNITRTTDAKIAVFTCPFDSMTTETKGTVLLKTASELMEFSKGEEQMIEMVRREGGSPQLTSYIAGHGTCKGSPQLTSYIAGHGTCKGSPQLTSYIAGHGTCMGSPQLTSYSWP